MILVVLYLLLSGLWSAIVVTCVQSQSWPWYSVTAIAIDTGVLASMIVAMWRVKP